VTLPAPTGARVTVDSRAAPYFRRMHDIMYLHNWDPPQATTAAYNCRAITGGTGYSLHAYGIAGDYDWDRNPYGATLITNMPQRMVDEILAIRTNNGDLVFRWGGYYSGNKDAMHYEIIAAPSTLTSGLSAGTCSYGGSSGQCVHSARCTGTAGSGVCPGTASIVCCTGTVISLRSGGGGTTTTTGTSGGGTTTYGSCTVSGTTGVCKDYTTCNGLSTTGLCPGSSSIRCCYTPSCTAGSNGAGKCMKTTACTSGYHFGGYCPGDSTIQCCTRPLAGAAEADLADFAVDVPFNGSTYDITGVGDDVNGDPEDYTGGTGSSSLNGANVATPATMIIAVVVAVAMALRA